VDRDDGLEAGVLVVAENDFFVAGRRDGVENHLRLLRCKTKAAAQENAADGNEGRAL
jgi:hypothetical protein